MSRNTSLPNQESGVLHTSKSKGSVNAAQMKAPARRFKVACLDNDLTLLHDYSSFIQPLLWWEGGAASWIRGLAEGDGGEGRLCVNESDFFLEWFG